MLENIQKIYNLDSSDYSIDVNAKPINLDIIESETKSKKEEDIAVIEDPSTVSSKNELTVSSETIFRNLNTETIPQILLLEETKPKTNSNPNSVQKQINNFDLNNNFGWLGDQTTDLTDATHLLICNCTVCQGQSFVENTTSLSQSQIAATTTTTTYSLNSLPVLSSNPNATAKIYLDFNGHTTTETLWNSWVASGKNIITPAYSIDTDTTTFNDAELTAIGQIWQRVAEDYAPFNIDVTTVAPTNYSAKTAVRVAIGGSSSDWYGNGAGGVAFVGSWTWGEDTPAFVFENNLGNGNVKNAAEAISHEVGHTLGLKHQSTYDATGKRTQEYSTGSGSGETSWAPIMGVGYSKNLTTWHNGANSNSSTSYQDDMAIISSSGNGFGYRQDDYGNSISTAKVLSGSTQLSASGIITTNADVDVFRFSTGTGNINFDIKGASLGQNLDIVAKLLDSNGSVILTSDLSDKINANISKSLNAGTYYLQVGSNGKYGRVGQYTVAGTLSQAVAEVAPEVSINDVRITEGQSSNLASFTVSLSKAATSAVSVNFATLNGTAFSGEDYLAKTGTIDFATGETSRTVTVQINDDSFIEAEETFSLKLSNANGLTIKDDMGIGTIVSNDVSIVPDVSVNNVRITEGQANNLASFTVSLSQAASSAVSVDFATLNVTAFSGEDYLAKTGTINFATGETSKTVTVQINDDSLIEGEETFNLKLSNAKGLRIADDLGIGTIVSDDVNNSSSPVAMGEIGTLIDMNSAIRTVTFQNTYENPVVFAQPLSGNYSDSAVVRITDITSNNFSFTIDEPNSNDGNHGKENFSFMVMEAGTWQLDNGATIQVGTLNTNANVNNNWQNVAFGSNFTNTPVVLTQVQSDNGTDFIRTRQQNANASGFSLAMEKEEALMNSQYTQEKVGWLAITSGTGDWDGRAYQADYLGDRTTDRWTAVNFAPDFQAAPQLLANIASYDDSDPVGLRYRRLNDVSVEVMLDEDTSVDSERTHATENVSFLAIDGAGVLTAWQGDAIANASLSQTIQGTDLSDLFVLGDRNGAYYNNSGDTDYALIVDFQIDRDIIQLHGSVADYRVAISGNGLPEGIAIYDNGNDLIGIVKDYSSLNLNSSAFGFI